MQHDHLNSPFAAAQRPRPLPVLLLADVSGSMAADGKINSLNAAVATMIQSFAKEDSVRGEIAVGVITFGGSGASLHHPITPATEAHWSDMSAGGRTPLGEALDLACSVLEDETLMPKRAFEATLVLISDGIPTDDWQPRLEQLLGSRRGSKSLRLAVAIGPEAGSPAYRVLEAFVADPTIPVVRAEEADRLTQFFRWLTRSVSTRVHSARPDDLATFDPDELYHLTD